MRVPTRFLFETRKDAIVKNQDILFNFQKKISSGLKIIRPSDSPAEYSVARGIEVHISKLARDIADSSEALTFLQAKEEVLARVSDLLAQAKLYAERGIDAQSSEEFASLASAVEEMIKQAVDLANTSIRGRFIFGGSKISPTSNSYRKPYEDREILDQEVWSAQKGVEPSKTLGEEFRIKEGKFTLEVKDPSGNTIFTKDISYFDGDRIGDLANRINTEGGGLVLASVSPDGKLRIISSTPGFKFSIKQDTMGIFAEFGGDGIPEYHGDNSSFSIEIKSAMVRISTPGKEIFGDPSRSDSEGVLNTLKNLLDILRFKKEGNTQELLRSAVLDIEKAYEKLNSERARVGAEISFVQGKNNLLNFIKTQDSIRKPDIEGLDMASASVDLTLKESVTQASMIVAVRAFELTLMRFL
ncbi:Flagellar hook-associated protein 3 [bacterium HR19]|nr:Flagellar hook-associated protein 3 [bacterium HR19]